MSPATKRNRRKFSDAEKERIRYVRKRGACYECRIKKRKCFHIPAPADDRPSPSTESGGSEPDTPGSDVTMNLEDYVQKPVSEGFRFEDWLNNDKL